MSRSKLRRRRPETGAVAIILALGMSVLCVCAALTLDLGLARSDKLSNKIDTDAAATSGIRYMDNGEGVSRPFRGACAAIEYLKASHAANLTSLVSGWKTGAGTPLVNPCSGNGGQLNTICVPDTPSTWACADLGTPSSTSIVEQMASHRETRIITPLQHGRMVELSLRGF